MPQSPLKLVSAENSLEDLCGAQPSRHVLLAVVSAPRCQQLGPGLKLREGAKGLGSGEQREELEPEFIL